MAYGFNDKKEKQDVYTKTESDGKYRLISDSYTKDEVYAKTETYPQEQLYTQSEVDQLILDLKDWIDENYQAKVTE